jgi:hypothetical protein
MSREPDDYGGGPPSGRSGAVTAVAVVNFVLGALNVICGIVMFVAFNSIMGLFSSAFSQAAQQQPGMTAEQQKQLQQASGVMGTLGTAGGIILGTCGLIFGILYILGGVGVLNRRSWGRILTIILGIFAAIIAVLALFTLNIPVLVVDGGYAIFVLIVLFNSKNAAEFRS